MAIDTRWTKSGNMIFDDNAEIVGVIKDDIIEFDSSKIGGGGSSLEPRVETLEEKIAGLEEFSTDEVDTGMEWIDGKRIYRKVFTFTPRSFSSGRNEITMDTSNYDTLVNARVFDVTSENRRCVQASCRVASSSTMGFYVNDTWADISVALLEYTKKN